MDRLTEDNNLLALRREQRRTVRVASTSSEPDELPRRRNGAQADHSGSSWVHRLRLRGHEPRHARLAGAHRSGPRRPGCLGRGLGRAQRLYQPAIRRPPGGSVQDPRPVRIVRASHAGGDNGRFRRAETAPGTALLRRPVCHPGVELPADRLHGDAGTVRLTSCGRRCDLRWTRLL